MCTKNTTLRKENSEQRELLKKRKNCASGKRVALKGKFVFSTQEVFKIAKEAEEATARKTSRKRCRSDSAGMEIGDCREHVPEIVSSNSESDCIMVVQRK